MKVSLKIIILALVLVYTAMMISSMMIGWQGEDSSDQILLMKKDYAYSYTKLKSNRPCRVIIEDKVDYHFEVS